MTDSPDAIRADIERTREELGADVDALADKVTPSKIVHRQTDKISGALGSLRDRVMGVADDAGSSASDLAHGAADVAHDVKVKAAGNPLAVGLIAFGVGLVIASLIPASKKEKELAESIKQEAEPFVDEVTSVAKEMAADLKEPARDAATAVKDRAEGAFEAVRDEASTAAGSVKDTAQGARENLSNS
jgi:gas vesicle protein